MTFSYRPLATLFLLACTTAPDDTGVDNDTLATVARHSAELSSQAAALAIIATDPLAAGVADERAAADAALAAAITYFDDGGCITPALDPETPGRLVLTLDDCDGPYGLTGVTAEVAILYTRSGAGLRVFVELNGEIDDLEATMALTIAVPDLANPRSITVETDNHLVLDDFTLSLAGDFTLTWDAALCFTLAAQLAATAGEATLSATIDDLSRCAGECPSGTVTLTAGDRSVAVIFDGDRTAQVIVQTPESEQTIPLPIFCS